MKNKLELKTIYYSDIEKQIFFSSHKGLMETFGCYYLAYFFEDYEKGIRIGFNSNPDWMKEYFGNQLIKNCHLYSVGKKQFEQSKINTFIFPWETATAKTSLEKDIALYREEMGIGHNGISFTSRKSKLREAVAFAPDTKTPNFLSLVNNNLELIKNSISVYRNITTSLFSKIQN